MYNNNIKINLNCISLHVNDNIKINLNYISLHVNNNKLHKLQNMYICINDSTSYFTTNNVPKASKYYIILKKTFKKLYFLLKFFKYVYLRLYITMYIQCTFTFIHVSEMIFIILTPHVSYAKNKHQYFEKH